MADKKKKRGLADSAASMARRLAAERGNTFIAQQGQPKRKKQKSVSKIGRLIRAAAKRR